MDLQRTKFKVHLIVPKLYEQELVTKTRWSEILKIPIHNFTKISEKPDTNLEYCHLQFNSIILVELMKLLYTKLKSILLQNKQFASGFMRSIIAGEGQVELKSWGTLSYVSISSNDLAEVKFYKECLNSLGIESCKYEIVSRKFPIYGRRNFEKMKLFNLLSLHPEKLNEFESGLSNYKRNVMKVEEMKELILKELVNQSKTYDEISNSLKKGRSTIQAFYVPMLEKQGLINRMGKRKQAWLFTISKTGIGYLENLN